MFKEKELWTDIGYRVVSGTLELGCDVLLERDPECSPDFLAGLVPQHSLISFMTFSTKVDQDRWIADQISKNLGEDELTHRDIMVIHPNPLAARNETGSIRSLLIENDINNHLAGVSTSPDSFFIEDSIAFTSIYRAKGNEAPMVYIMSAEYCYSGLELSKLRNTLFTAITRSKGWVVVCGVGAWMRALSNEFEKAKNIGFKLKFTYPTEAEMEEINTIHRGLSETERASIEDSNRNLKKIVERLRTGEIKPQDLSKDEIDFLKSQLP